MSAFNVQMRRKGTITLPVELQRKYSLGDGDVFALEDLGDGCFLLIPRVSRMARLAEKVAGIMQEDGVSPDEVLETLEAEREKYYQERYAQV
jgi:bifunctional DNA-binding transcriptional regulator/antitoxin component of YhaV-PrlF toxin-antitoxin module